MDYLKRQADQLRDEPPEHRTRDQQPNRHGNAQETLDDLHGGGRLSEPGEPLDGPPCELAGRQPDWLDNEQVIDGQAGAMPATERRSTPSNALPAEHGLSVAGSSSRARSRKDISNTRTTIGESAAGEPHPYADPNSNSGTEASRTYVCSRHNEFQSSYFEGTTVFGDAIINYPQHLDESGKIASNRGTEPISMVPSWQNPAFVGREEILVQLESLLQRDGDNQKQPRAAIYGLGGIGKTAIAIEFCYRRKKSKPTKHIFWLYGDSHDAFNNSYLDLGRQAGILDDDAQDERWRIVVKNWLDSSASGNWIMVIDNLYEVDSYLEGYLPVQRGAILYTTRDGSIRGNVAYVAPGACVTIDSMTDAEGMDMFVKHLPIRDGTDAPLSRADILDLLKHLGNLPLAIAQAAAYIRETGVQVSSYVRMFKECERNQQELLEDPLPSSSQESKRPGSRAVMTTWTITLSNIQRKYPDSVRLLEFMSYIAPDDIAKGLLRGLPFLKDESDIKYNKAFAPLLSFSLIYPLKSANFRLHRLVGLYIRRRMESEDRPQRDSLLTTIFGLLGNAFPENISFVTQNLRLAAHAWAALSHTPDGYQYHPSGIGLMQKFGKFMVKRGDYDGGLSWLQRALDGREKALGKDHPNTYVSRGEYGKALDWYQRALNGCEKALGNDHPVTLTTVNNMANIYLRQGEPGKALKWYQRALDGREKALGKDHPDTLTTVNEMANTFVSQGEYGKASVFYQRALDGREKALGKDHPDTLATVNNMAFTYNGQGKYGEALVFYLRALDGCETALGKDHPNTLTIVSNMASIFVIQRQYVKALVWYQRALHGRETALGKDHPDTLATAKNISDTYIRQGSKKRWFGVSPLAVGVPLGVGAAGLPVLVFLFSILLWRWYL